MPDSNRDFEKAQETISELLKKLALSMNKLSSVTREDINYLRGRLDLLEYLTTPKPDGRIEAYTKPVTITCAVCGIHHGSIYQHLGTFFCPAHYPAGVTFPIGMHGDEFKAYQERKK